MIVKCPKCKNENVLDIRSAIDEEGEVYFCSHCGCKFRFALK